jgi:hypothetical protein
MTPLPIVRGVSAALYPFRQTFIAQTGKSDGQNATPTRWVKGPPLVRLELPTNRLSQADKDTLKAAFVSAKGQFASDLRLTTYQHWDYLSFDSDEFVAVESRSTRYDVKWSLTSTLAVNYGAGTAGTAYPQLVYGSIAKLPFTQKKRFQTINNKMPSGPQYSYAEFAGGLSNFPTDGLMSWESDYHNLLDTEVNTLLAHWLSNWGDCLPFTFTDEDSVTYSNVYYASPEFTISWDRYNSASIRTVLIQMF